jgi:hypothetical protein
MELQGMTWYGMERQGKAIHLDTFYYISIIIFIPLGIDVLNILGMLCALTIMY